MTGLLRYSLVGTAVVALGVLGSWPFLDPVGHRGLVVAACVALPIQIGSFALLQRFRGQLRRFLAVWVGGTVLRMAAIGAVAFLVIQSGPRGVAPTLLALAAFFFALLLLEPIYFGAGRNEAG